MNIFQKIKWIFNILFSAYDYADAKDYIKYRCFSWKKGKKYRVEVSLTPVADDDFELSKRNPFIDACDWVSAKETNKTPREGEQVWIVLSIYHDNHSRKLEYSVARYNDGIFCIDGIGTPNNNVCLGLDRILGWMPIIPYKE